MARYYFDPALRGSVESLLLPEIQLPGQYIGGELGTVVKRADSVRGRFCFTFPDAYAIGMSNYAGSLLYSIVNSRKDLACERAFTPFPDMEQKLRERKLPLYSLETFSPLWSFEVIGFTLQHEMSGTNILTMLDLGGIALDRQARSAFEPLVIAGGPSSFNPEPLSRFIDVFCLGDGEETLPKLLDRWFDLREKRGLPRVFSSEKGQKPDAWRDVSAESRSLRREMLLEIARGSSSLYVPEFYEVKIGPSGRVLRPRPTESGVPERIVPAQIARLDDYPPPTFPIVPLIESVQDRVAVEIMRGCPQKCRFCQSSTTKRPLRFRSVEQIVESAQLSCEKTGISEVTLLSLSSSEYPQFDELLAESARRLAPEGIAVSVPSLRVNHQLSQVVSELSTERSGSLTLAPEAALDGMRKRIAKKVTNADLLAGCRSAFENGFTRIKMYFMCGFPGETEADLDGIIALSSEVARLGKEVRGRWPSVVANVSNFVPKPQTPLQWSAMATEEVFRAAHARLRAARRPKAVDLKYHFLPASLLEGLIARGDRRIGAVIESAWRKGARFDAWKDHFDPRLWDEAVQESGIDRSAIAHSEYDPTDELPWDQITIWASRAKLEKEFREFQKI